MIARSIICGVALTIASGSAPAWAQVRYSCTAQVVILERDVGPAAATFDESVLLLLGAPRSSPGDEVQRMLHGIFGGGRVRGEPPLQPASIDRDSVEAGREKWPTLVHDVTVADRFFEVRMTPIRMSPLTLQVDVHRAAVARTKTGVSQLRKVSSSSGNEGTLLSTQVTLRRESPLVVLFTDGRRIHAATYWWTLVIGAIR